MRTFTLSSLANVPSFRFCAARVMPFTPCAARVSVASMVEYASVTGTRCSTLSIGLSSELQAVSTVIAAAKRICFVFIVYFVLLFYM